MISEEKFKNIKGESPIYDESYGRKQLKATNQIDIIKGIVEIIKNGVDAYIEENEEELEGCNKEKIQIFANSIQKTISITNFAKGMSEKDWSQALKIGGDTGSKKESKTSAHGYGMKEASWAFENTIITSINDKNYSSRIFWWNEKGNPKFDWDRDFEGKILKEITITKDIKNKTQINREGTFLWGKFQRISLSHNLILYGIA
ncbi:MAG: ATP-binding protein [Nanoarchaeota archaeon]